MYKIGDNIISSLGFTTGENFDAVKQGVSGIKQYNAGVFDLPEPFMASLINKERLNDEFNSFCGLELQSQKIGNFDLHRNSAFTALEKAAILSIFLTNKEAQIDLASARTLFIFSTTKGNVDILNMGNSQIYLWHTAELISVFFKNPNTPIVVSNACISGVAAQIVAQRELESKNYDYAVIVGVDFLSKFIISGFQAFQALSPELCRPFSKNRCGLNLGEAAATMIFSRDMRRLDRKRETIFSLVAGAVRNDATHISAPSRIGEGSFRALNSILTSCFSPHPSQIAFINAHGTATPYNDAMEMNAIARAGLESVPVNALKSYFGHTLGAAGVVETIISMRALGEEMMLKTLGFEESEQLIINNEQFTLDICKENRATDKKYFIKMMSGFGGVNAALLFAANKCHELH
jgi:3-oxoacyl-[acyl-carrier-protein] synthase-1